MRSLMLLILSSFFLLSAEPGCEKTADASLTGKWNWVKTRCCGRMNTTTTPESSGNIRILELNADYTYRELMDNEVKKTGTYETRTGLNDYAVETGDKRDVILFDRDRPGYYYYIKDTLVIDFGYMDLQTDYYLPLKK